MRKFLFSVLIKGLVLGAIVGAASFAVMMPLINSLDDACRLYYNGLAN